MIVEVYQKVLNRCVKI